MHKFQLILIYRSKQSDAHNALTKTIGAQVSDFGPQLLELKRGLSDQGDTIIQSIINTQACLAQLMSTQHTEVRDHQHSQARNLESAFASQKSTTAQIGVDVQNTNTQLQALLALQHSLVGFVFFRYLMRETRSYVADILQRCNAFPGAIAPYLARESYSER